MAIVPVALLAIAGGFWFAFSGKKADFHQTLPSNDGILTISNADNANLTILTAQIDTVIVDIQGPADQVGKIRFISANPPDSKFDLPPDWGNLSGTVTVPKGTLIELKPSRKTPVTVEDSKGKRPAAAGIPLLVDTSNLTLIRTGRSTIDVQGNGSVTVEEDPLGSAGGGSGTGEGPASCGFGPLLLRNRCCAKQNANSPKPPCAGNWIFDDMSNACAFECAPTTPRPGTVGGGGGGGDAGTGGGNTPAPLPGAAPQDPTSQRCMSNDVSIRSQCCDESLRNPLRIGPRPGFPDCIGRWYFDPLILNCKFRCADYGEMLQILTELGQYAPTE